MGLFRAIHDWFYPHKESHDECLRRGVRENVHSFHNQAMIETQQLRQARDQLAEVSRMTRRTIKRLEVARERANRKQKAI